MTGKIEINSFENFQTLIGRLKQLTTDLDTHIGKSEQVVETATAAAGKSASGESVMHGQAVGGSKVAPAYAASVAALSTAVGSIVSQAQASRSAVESAASELENLMNNQRSTQNQGADAVNNVG